MGRRRAPLIETSAHGGPTLTRDDASEITCIGDATCVASTTRPVLEAEVDPNADGQDRYVVFDLTGAGGTTKVMAEQVGAGPTWAPPAGLLEHGHSFARTTACAPTSTSSRPKSPRRSRRGSSCNC